MLCSFWGQSGGGGSVPGLESSRWKTAWLTLGKGERHKECIHCFCLLTSVTFTRPDTITWLGRVPRAMRIRWDAHRSDSGHSKLKTSMICDLKGTFERRQILRGQKAMLRTYHKRRKMCCSGEKSRKATWGVVSEIRKLNLGFRQKEAAATYTYTKAISECTIYVIFLIKVIL